MKKVLTVAALFFLFVQWVAAQGNELLVESGPSGLYLDHVVARGQTFYAIGRRYFLDPNEIASFNHVSLSDPLSVGQHLKIPLTAANFNQADRNGTPVYYKVNRGEGLYRVGVNNNDVPLDNLRTWNRLSDDNLNAGQKLIVGFLSESGTETAQSPATTPQQEEPRAPARESQPETRRADPPVVTQEPPKRQSEQRQASETSPPPVNTVYGESGYFKAWFDQQQKLKPAGRDLTVTSGIFKTASGWQDAKYYLLIDKVQPGTIVKITNPGNDKVVYAKVLGEMSSIRQNQGLDIRMSNAAASVLGIADTDKFVVQVNF